MTTRRSECAYWHELRMIDADESFDSGEWSGRVERQMRNSPCGECDACVQCDEDDHPTEQALRPPPLPSPTTLHCEKCGRLFRQPAVLRRSAALDCTIAYDAASGDSLRCPYHNDSNYWLVPSAEDKPCINKTAGVGTTPSERPTQPCANCHGCIQLFPPMEWTL